jgi:hypothetical protein
MLLRQREKLFELQPPVGLKFVYCEGKGMSVFADRGFSVGETVIDFPNTLVHTKDASEEAVQVDDDLWIDTEWLVPEAFINHSCDPNTKLEYRPNEPTSRYAAIKPIARDEEITFNYNTTEWDAKQGFDCECSSSKCVHHIRGLKYLTQEQQEELRPLLLPYLIVRLQVKA